MVRLLLSGAHHTIARRCSYFQRKGWLFLTRFGRSEYALCRLCNYGGASGHSLVWKVHAAQKERRHQQLPRPGLLAGETVPLIRPAWHGTGKLQMRAKRDDLILIVDLKQRLSAQPAYRLLSAFDLRFRQSPLQVPLFLCWPWGSSHSSSITTPTFSLQPARLSSCTMQLHLSRQQLQHQPQRCSCLPPHGPSFSRSLCRRVRAVRVRASTDKEVRGEATFG